ncbi:MAG: polysaccharide deacetylase family protein [Clostridiales bacterium]|nr:polysaccharide deacetylase family protein [Clostridiales bacterium]
MANIILTIDDMPQNNTVAIIDYLESKGIKPLFFGIGEFLEKLPEPAIYALKKGLIIGNHTYSHVNLAEVSFEEGIEEIEKCERILDDIYKRAGVTREHKLFRFPYLNGGENGERYDSYLREHGFERIDDRSVTDAQYKENGWDREIGVYCSFDCREYLLREGSPMTIGQIYDDIDSVFLPLAGDDTVDHIVLTHSHDLTDENEPLYYEKIVERFLQDKAVFKAPSFRKP